MHSLTLSGGQRSANCHAIGKGKFAAILLVFLGSNTTSACMKSLALAAHA